MLMTNDNPRRKCVPLDDFGDAFKNLIKKIA